MIAPMLLVKASAILAAAKIFTNEKLLAPHSSEINDIDKEKEKANEFFVYQKTLQQDFINSFVDNKKIKSLEADKEDLSTMMGIINSFLEL